MTHADNFNRPNKGILKWSKPLLSRSASLQSKRTCFKEEYAISGVENLSKTFNFGCSLDIAEYSCQNKDFLFSSKSFECNESNLIGETISEEDDSVTLSQNPDFIERRKSFEMKANVHNFQGVVDLRAVLAHRIPDLEPEDDEEEKVILKCDKNKSGPKTNSAHQISTDNCTNTLSDFPHHILDVEMSDNV